MPAKRTWILFLPACTALLAACLFRPLPIPDNTWGVDNFAYTGTRFTAMSDERFWYIKGTCPKGMIIFKFKALPGASPTYRIVGHDPEREGEVQISMRCTRTWHAVRDPKLTPYYTAFRSKGDDGIDLVVATRQEHNYFSAAPFRVVNESDSGIVTWAAINNVLQTDR